jgi:D-alanine-D-alanine ligase
MDIVLAYDPRWDYIPEGHTTYWESLDTVEYVAELLRKTGNTVMPVVTDDSFESRLKETMNQHPGALVFWLNEFVPMDPGATPLVGRPFIVSVLENLGLMHTGPGSAALAIGLDKEATKDVFRKLGLLTPESYVVHPGDFRPIYQHGQWHCPVIIKPLLHGGSIGIDQFSVVPDDDFSTIRERAERIHKELGEPALVERYIGGENAREFSVPVLLSNDGRVGELPIIEIDLSHSALAHGEFRYLAYSSKRKEGFIQIPAELPSGVTGKLYSDAGRISREVGCRDMTRIDLRYDSTGYYYIEVNVNPGKDRLHCYLPASAQSLGLDHESLIALIPYQAMLRYGLTPPRELTELVQPVMALFDVSQAAS